MLTEVQIKKFPHPNQGHKKLFDGGGLYLFVSPTAKLWRFKYRFAGKERTLSFGPYPAMTLRQARDKAEDARRALRSGVDPSPSAALAASVAEESFLFGNIAREWLEVSKPGWANSNYCKIDLRIKNDVLPLLGKRDIRELKAREVLDVLLVVSGRGAVDTAKRVQQNIGQIFRFAVARGYCEHNPVPNLRGALPSVEQVNYPALTKPAEVGELIRSFDGFRGSHIVRCALRLAPLVFVRPGELRQARWQDFDFDLKTWTYFVTKTKTTHIVPLSRQALTILDEIRPFTAGESIYVFPGPRDKTKPLSPAAIGAALRRLGWNTKTEITGHGFRAMARTILAERLKILPNIIEHQLAHRVPGPLGTAYDRTTYIDERTEMMQAWADYLDSLVSASR